MYKQLYFFHRLLQTGLFYVLLLLGTPLEAQLSALKEHVKILTADSLTGRGIGTEGEKKAAAYISRYLEACGVDFPYPSGIQDFSVIGRLGDTLSSQNIVAIISGSDPQLKEEYIVVGAHYDHLGTRKITIDGKDSLVIYPGADDNASGVALLLELAKAASQQPYLFKRSLVFVAFGAEEIGMIGSWYFVNRAFSAINNVVLMINLDMLGRSGSKNPFFAYTVEPHAALFHALHYVGELPLMVQPNVSDTDYFPSDHLHFFSNKIPVVLFTNGLHADYHTPMDKTDLLDYNEMEQRMTYIYSFLIHMSNDPSWNEEVASLEKIYLISQVDSPPTFQRGNVEKFLKSWINKYLKYPNRAIIQGIQGRVLVQFIVEANGSVTHVEVIESVDPLLDEEAIRVVAASPKWNPGRKNGQNVRTQCVVPVYFALKRR